MMTARSVRTEYSKILLELEHSKLLKSYLPFLPISLVMLLLRDAGG